MELGLRKLEASRATARKERKKKNEEEDEDGGGKSYHSNKREMRGKIMVGVRERRGGRKMIREEELSSK